MGCSLYCESEPFQVKQFRACVCGTHGNVSTIEPSLCHRKNYCQQKRTAAARYETCINLSGVTYPTFETQNCVVFNRFSIFVCGADPRPCEVQKSVFAEIDLACSEEFQTRQSACVQRCADSLKVDTSMLDLPVYKDDSKPRIYLIREFSAAVLKHKLLLKRIVIAKYVET